MAQFFGEYLVEKSVISEVDLLEALVSQAKATPSTLEVVYSQKVLTPEQILLVLKTQVLNGLEFVGSCKHLGFWSEENEAAVYSALAKERVPLGKILLKESKIEIKELIAALDDFLADRIDEDLNKTEDLSAQLKPVANSGTLKNGIDEIALESYLENFNKDLFTRLEQLIMGVEPTSPNFLTDLKQVRKEFDALLGLAKIVGLSRSQELLEKALDQSVRFVEKADGLEEKLVWEFKSAGKVSLDILWDIRQALIEGKQESESLAEPNKESVMATVLQDWVELNRKVS